MNRKKIEEVLELMEKYNLTEIDYEEEGVRIHLKKGGHIVSTPIITQHVQPQVVPQAVKEAAPAETKQDNGKKYIEVKAPMVGTFYRSPAPDADPYVDIGKVIKEGDVLCIIEAMKLMNEIKSEVKGKIVDVMVENGQPIEFGQVLFLVEPN